jgi:hypothetical protein
VSRKAAVITVELVEESVGSANSTIADDLIRWFNDAVLPAPWVKRVRLVSVQRFSDAE